MLSSADHGTTNGFRPSLAFCGEVQFTADLYQFVDTNNPVGPEPLTDVAGNQIVFATDGTLTIFIDEVALLGYHEMRISASLVTYPAIVTATETVLPLKFASCELSIAEWTIGDVVVPIGAQVHQIIEEPTIVY